VLTYQTAYVRKVHYAEVLVTLLVDLSIPIMGYYGLKNRSETLLKVFTYCNIFSVSVIVILCCLFFISFAVVGHVHAHTLEEEIDAKITTPVGAVILCILFYICQLGAAIGACVSWHFGRKLGMQPYITATLNLPAGSIDVKTEVPAGQV